MTARPRARRATLVTVGAAALLAGGVAAPVSAVASPAGPATSVGTTASVLSDPDDWAPVDEATITPGVQMYTEGGQCTSNFVFTDAEGTTYVGYSAHCAGTGESSDVDGCRNGSLPLGTRVEFAEGGSLAEEGTQVGGGELVYSSWLTMDELGESDPDTCLYNDFALVEVDTDDVDQVNPSVPIWGGPVGIDSDGLAAGEQVYSYGMSSLRSELNPLLSPKTGAAMGDASGAWTHPLYTLSPGIPGDSGSAFLDSEGDAVGSLSTLTILPIPGGNNIADINLALGYAQEHSGIEGLEMVAGTEDFSG
ncbi:hypothetical protein [Nocardioides sp. CFH 31398]|uniref:hypothetical protein n=1 Tax=Nocardioides sp. CFH 31398 TaxID=2919579 RepID=UPI001F05BEE5|nr:hypothetical protein [Nocardioides sp. CFH 31398]MCH1866492.1 hypothetical protein [Nocardioides sp. CFH 31398]